MSDQTLLITWNVTLAEIEKRPYMSPTPKELQSLNDNKGREAIISADYVTVIDMWFSENRIEILSLVW